MELDISRHTFTSHELIQLANTATLFLKRTPSYPLPLSASFVGAGVYALYYRGDHPRYRAIKGKPVPIYIGKAVPTGSRTGSGVQKEERKLKARLNEHTKSIEHADNLSVRDFTCQFMVIPAEMSALIPVVESTLIRQHRPLWNAEIDGFGNHDPGKGRYKQAKSEWDILHPGRAWAERLTG